MMRKWVKYIVCFLFLLGIMNTNGYSQSVGVNSVVVIFESTPTYLNITKTPLKYNKEFALSFHIKNANKDIYTHAFPYLNGGTIESINYPGLTFTDGCDNPVNFKLGTSLYSFAADGFTDIHNPTGSYTNSFITWPETIELYQAGWGIFSQGLLPDNSGDPSYSVARNHSYVKFKTYGSISGGLSMTVLMNPEGDTTFSTTAFDQDYRAAFASYTQGIQYYDIDLIPNIDSLKMGINSMDNQESLASLTDLIHTNYSPSTRLWASANLSTITDGNTKGYSFSVFQFYMDYIEDTYGSGGLDNIWMTNEEEVWDYLTTYNLITLNQEILSDRLLITFSGNLPTHLKNYALSLFIDSDANIESIEINGGSNNTYKIKADTSALINLNWDGAVLIADTVLAENYVAFAEANRTTENALVAMDYVNMLEFGTKKEELRNRLCAITEATMPLGYCSCEFSLGNDTTICKNDCIDLTGPEGTSYLWSTGETTQSIEVCPSDTTEYWLTVFNEYDCYFSDTILVQVVPDNFANASSDVTICASSCVDLTVSSGASYLWTTGKTTQTINVCPDVETKYYAIVTDAIGCVSIDSVTVSLNETPVSEVSADVSICKFDSTILTISGASNYLWSTLDNTSSIKVSPADTTKYYVWSWNENNCLVKDSVTVNIIPLPIAEAGNDTTICLGNCVTLTANDGYTYEWNTSETTQNINVCPDDTTTYYVTVENQHGCTNIDSVDVIVKSVPEVQTSNDTLICPSQCVKIWASGGTSYLWDTGETTDTITICPTEATNYHVSVFNNLGCETRDSVFVDVFNATNVALTEDVSICPNDCITLTAGGGYAYEWSTGGTTNKITVCPETDSTFYVTVYNEYNCPATDSVLVSLRTPPIIDAGIDTETCLGNCVTLTASGGTTYEWNTNDLTQSIEVCPNDTTTYYVTGTDEFGCSSIDSVNVLVKPVAETQTSNDTIICPNQCVKIWIAGGTSYLWDTGETTDTITVCPAEATKYYVSVFNDLNCEVIDSVFVDIFSTSGVSVTEDVEICPGSCTTLLASGGYAYEWSDSTTINSTTVCPEITTRYYVTVYNEYNCPITDSVLVSLRTLPTIDAGNDTSKCISDCINLTASDGLTSYFWSNSDTNRITEVCPSTQTKYYVTGTDEFGCAATDSVIVSINDHPEVSLSGILPAYCEDASAVLLEGNPADGIFGGTGVNANIFSPGNAGIGEHQVYYSIVDNSGCAVGDTINVQIYEIPIFTLGDDITLCTDETYEIFLPTGFDQYIWSNGELSGRYFYVTINNFEVGTNDLSVVVTNHGCVARDTVEITFESCNVGIEDLEDIGIIIYPNPSSGIFKIDYDGTEDNQYFSVFTMQGQEIYTEELNECREVKCNKTLDFSFLNKGIYLIRFYTKKGIRSGKIIIQ